MRFNQFQYTKRQYNKRNFNDVIEVFIPDLYLNKDIEASGTRLDPLSEIINSHITIAENIGTILPLSAGTTFSSLDTLSGIMPFFVKQNNFTKISAESFERKILNLDNKSFRDFNSSAQFSTYLENTLLPKIQTNNPTLSSIDYLSVNLGWFYFLAGSSVETYQPSTVAVDYIVSHLYTGGSLGIDDGINALTEFLWRNNSSYIPATFLSGSGEYVSGTQQLEKLKTLNSIIYSTALIDKQDTKVQDAFEDYIDTSNLISERVSNGPFWKLVKAFSFAFADQQDEVNKINTLYDLQDCPNELLPDLARIIGWPLLGYDPNRWRLQLANAVGIYKRAGTKQSIQAAINSVFTEGVVDLDGFIYEVWESYIPFLIMYSLATESIHFSDYSSWTREKAQQLGINRYDSQNFENNIKLAVDKILLTLAQEFPNHFLLCNEPFDVGSSSFVFNYRGRNYPIPPFEEIPYYVGCDISQDFLLRLADLLVCFGVPQSFALQVKSFIETNTINATDTIRDGNGWLMFTSGVETPPNWSKIIGDPNNKKENFLSLWSGKSSHYKLIFSGGDFDFSKSTYEVDSREVILIAARAADLFSPAHAIQDTKVFLDDTDLFAVSSTDLPIILFDRTEQISQMSSMTFGNYEISAIDFLDGASAFTLKRDSYDSLTTDIMSRVSASATSERNALRRRSFHNSLNLGGFYDRTGFNMPSVLSMHVTGIDNNALSLGFIPSALHFASALDLCQDEVSAIPEIYRRCSWNSSSITYGYNTSSTFKYRGHRPVYSDAKNVSSVDYYLDRNQLDPYLAVAHRVMVEKVEKKYEQYVEDNFTVYAQDLSWKNVSKSLAAQEMNCSGMHLSSFRDFEDFSLNRKFAKLYDVYTSAFNRHPTRYDIANSPGPNVFAHAFGSLLENSDFETRGSIAVTYNLYNTSTSSVRVLDRSSPYFSGTAASLTTFSTYINSDPSSIIASSLSFPTTYELVNSSIINGVEMIHTSGASLQNQFVIYDLQAEDARSYIFNRALVRLRSINGLPRIRYRIEGSDFSEVYDTLRENNFLLPNHDFSLKINGLAANNSGRNLVGSLLGVWIHTDNEDGYSWHFANNGHWTRLPNTDLTINNILSNLTHTIRFREEDRSVDSSGGNRQPFQCLQVDEISPNSSLSSIGSFTQDEFQEYTIKFNTFNKPIVVPDAYYKNYNQVHRSEQKYIIEIFMIPSRENEDNFILLESINLRDDTLWDWTRIDVTGTPTGHKKFPLCDIKYVDLTREDVRVVFNYYNMICGKSYGNGILSRDSAESSGLNLDSGGGRLDYRTNPGWHDHSIDSTSKSYTQIVI